METIVEEGFAGEAKRSIVKNGRVNRKTTMATTITLTMIEISRDLNHFEV